MLSNAKCQDITYTLNMNHNTACPNYLAKHAPKARTRER